LRGKYYFMIEIKKNRQKDRYKNKVIKSVITMIYCRL
jgi:hypothetical protein